MFQSPSLRGSGRFRQSAAPPASARTCFNPLHCGAVVASPERAQRLKNQLEVSIPFIAGQWSLPRRGGKEEKMEILVSIPFIAGQWSLRGGRKSASARKRQRFNPLHCGAVVASLRSFSARCRFLPWFQSPSLRGSGRFRRAADAHLRHPACFNPLHCGAVVASTRRSPRSGKPPRFQSPSLRGSGRFSAAGSSGAAGRTGGFNPLHCGAVVASTSPKTKTKTKTKVSIPFIAGQWSLLPRTTPSSLFGVLLRKRRLPCDHIICTRLPF